MSRETRFSTEFTDEATDEPGLVLSESGDVEVVRPDGTRDVIGGADGGSQSLSVLGPFTVAYNNPDLTNDGLLLTELDSGTLVLGVYVVVDTAWDVAGAMQIGLGGPDYGPPDDDYTALWSSSEMQSAGPTVVGVKAFANSSVNDLSAGTQGATTSLFGLLTAPGALLALFGGSGAAQGSMRVWALVLAPS